MKLPTSEHLLLDNGCLSTSTNLYYVHTLYELASFCAKKGYTEKHNETVWSTTIQWCVQCVRFEGLWLLRTKMVAESKGVLVEHTSFPFAFCPPDWINWQLASINPPRLHCALRERCRCAQGQMLTHSNHRSAWSLCWGNAQVYALAVAFRLSLSLSPLARFVRCTLSLSLSVDKKPFVCSKVRVTLRWVHLWDICTNSCKLISVGWR